MLEDKSTVKWGFRLSAICLFQRILWVSSAHRSVLQCSTSSIQVAEKSLYCCSVGSLWSSPSPVTSLFSPFPSFLAERSLVEIQKKSLKKKVPGSCFITHGHDFSEGLGREHLGWISSHPKDSEELLRSTGAFPRTQNHTWGWWKEATQAGWARIHFFSMNYCFTAVLVT